MSIDTPTDLSRRKILVGGAAAAATLGVAASARAASFGNPDAPPEGRSCFRWAR
jgi:oxalate decarboxylase